MFSGILEEMTIEQVREFHANVVALPLGSTEPHGAALPYGTDTFSVKAIAERATRLANSRGGRVLCYPTLPITLNNNFRAWPFALRVSVPTMHATIVDICRQVYADGVRRVVIINGHGGTTDTIRSAMRDLAGMDDAPFVFYVAGWGMAAPEVKAAHSGPPSEHGGHAEAALQLHLHPECVIREKLANNPQCYPALPALRDPRVYFVRKWHQYVPAAAGGDQRAATAGDGKALLESAAETTGQLLLELSQAPQTPTFPY
jgi:creatinine amidohydrolase